MIVAYVPTPLRNMEEICIAFGVGEKQIKTWVKEGAPIAVANGKSKTRYCSEFMRLYLWYEEYCMKKSPKEMGGDDS